MPPISNVSASQGNGFLHPVDHLGRAGAGAHGIVRMRKVQREGEVGELETDILLHHRGMLRIVLQPCRQIVAVLALPVDAAIGADGDAGNDAHAALTGIAAQVLRGLDAAMAVAQEAVDDDASDAVLRAEIDQPAIVVEKALRRFLKRVEDADLLLADLRQFPVGGMVPGPEGPIGETRLAADRILCQRRRIKAAVAALDQLLDAIDHAGKRAATYDKRAGIGADRVGAFLQRFVEFEPHPDRVVRNDRLPQPPCGVGMPLLAFYDHACRFPHRLTE